MVAATHIGWQVNPFQFEVGMADLAKLASRSRPDVRVPVDRDHRFRLIVITQSIRS